jgi:hypothetical protein
MPTADAGNLSDLVAASSKRLPSSRIQFSIVRERQSGRWENVRNMAGMISALDQWLRRFEGKREKNNG